VQFSKLDRSAVVPNELENIPMSHPDFSTILDNASNHVSPNAHLPSLLDLVPQGLPPHESPTADLHAGGGIVDVAATHTDVTLPDLVSLTGHDWFVHT
jgi:hypothetical protein